MVSIFAVVCGTVVACFGLARQSREPFANAGPDCPKSTVEEDAYDVVSGSWLRRPIESAVHVSLVATGKGKVMHEGLIIPFGIFLPMFLVPTIITLVHRQKKREWQHQERLRAARDGFAVPAPNERLGGGSVVAIGAGVPVASVLGALITTLSVSYSMPDYMAILAVSGAAPS